MIPADQIPPPSRDSLGFRLSRVRLRLSVPRLHFDSRNFRHLSFDGLSSGTRVGGMDADFPFVKFQSGIGQKPSVAVVKWADGISLLCFFAPLSLF